MKSRTVKSRTMTVAVVITASSLMVAGCGSKGEAKSTGAASSGTLTIGASLSLTGSLAREGQLTKEGYQLCQEKVNAKGGVDIGGTKAKLDIQYQDDTSKPDVAAQLVDSFNDKGCQADPQLLRLGQHRGPGCGHRTQRPGHGRLCGCRQQDLQQGL